MKHARTLLSKLKRHLKGTLGTEYGIAMINRNFWLPERFCNDIRKVTRCKS